MSDKTVTCFGEVLLRLAAPGKEMLLHSARLAFKHPVSGEAVKLESSLPAEMKAFVSAHLP